MSGRIADVVVVTYANPHVERNCLDSVVRSTKLGEGFGLVVVDNAVRDANLGYVWNQEMERSKARWVCLLNSDTVVSDGWLEALVDAGDREVADAVGPVTNNCGIRLQVGSASPKYDVKEVPMLSGFCLLLRREAWKRVYGFRDDFPFYGQESELLRRIGKKVLARHVMVDHVGGGTAGLDPERRAEDKRLGMEAYRRNVAFDWSRRVLVFEVNKGRAFPLARGLGQAVEVAERKMGMPVRYEPVDNLADPRHVAEYRRWGPQMVIVVTNRGEMLKKIRPGLKALRGAKRALWFNDLRKAEGRAEWCRGNFERLFLCHRGSPEYPVDAWERLSGVRVSYMPQGSVISPELVVPERKKYNCLFVGSVGRNVYHADRERVVKALGAVVMNRGSPEDRETVEKQCPRLYREAKYVLSMSLPVDGYSSLRMYNVLAYGGVLLVRWFPGIERLVGHERHALVWRDAEEARELMRKYDDDDEGRERIARAGWRLQQAKHTVLCRLMNMIEMLDGKSDEFWGFYAD